MSKPQLKERLLQSLEAEPGSGADLVENAGVHSWLPGGEDDPGLIIDRGLDDPAGAIDRFMLAVAAHRSFARETDPPGV